MGELAVVRRLQLRLERLVLGLEAVPLVPVEERHLRRALRERRARRRVERREVVVVLDVHAVRLERVRVVAQRAAAAALDHLLALLAQLLRGRAAAPGRHAGVVAALLSRHGPDPGGVRVAAHPVRGRRPARPPGDADEPGRVPAEAGTLDPAAGHQPARLVGRTQLRLRAVGAPDVRRRPRGHGSRRGPGHHQR